MAPDRFGLAAPGSPASNRGRVEATSGDVPAGGAGGRDVLSSRDHLEYCDEVIRNALLAYPLRECDREDCRQDILLDLLSEKPSSFRGGSLRAWLSTVARNKAIDALRRLRRRQAGPLGDDLATAQASKGSASAADEARSLVWPAIAELDRSSDPTNYLVFYLRSFEGWPHDEIARALDLTPGQARVKYHRMKAKFRDLVAGQVPEGRATRPVADEDAT